MFDKNTIDLWLRNEAEKLEKDKAKIIDKTHRTWAMEGYFSLDKLNKYKIELAEVMAKQNKLYEMIGRIDELEQLK